MTLRGWEFEAERTRLKELERDEGRRIRDRYRERRDALRFQLLYGQEWGGVQPQPRYSPAFYAQLGGLEGSRPQMDWFEGLFPSLVRRFEAQLPTYEGFKTVKGAVRETEAIQTRWAEWLKGERTALKERWWSLTPFRRGEKPWAFQPMVRTRSF